MRLRNKILIALGVIVALAVTAVSVTIGPRNVVGMLRYDIRAEGSLKVGDRAPDLSLRALDGKEAHLKDRFGARPVVMIFGSFT